MLEKPERRRSGIGADASASTGTGSRRRKELFHPPKYNPRTPNDWWPFDRVDGRILVRAHRDAIQDIEDAPI